MYSDEDDDGLSMAKPPVLEDSISSVTDKPSEFDDSTEVSEVTPRCCCKNYICTAAHLPVFVMVERRMGHVGYCYTCGEEWDMLDTITPVKKNGTCWIPLHL